MRAQAVYEPLLALFATQATDLIEPLPQLVSSLPNGLCDSIMPCIGVALHLALEPNDGSVERNNRHCPLVSHSNFLEAHSRQPDTDDPTEPHTNQKQQ